MLHDPRVYVLDRNADVNVMEMPVGSTALLGYVPLELMDLHPNSKNIGRQSGNGRQTDV